MDSNENILDRLQELFGDTTSNLSILEEQIDLEVQMEYYEFSKNFNKEFSVEKIMTSKDDLFKKNIAIESKRLLLVKLASIGRVEAFRTLEKYVNKPDAQLRDWSRLALKESKMLLESKLLDRNQILITTGLGGKGMKLRYFVVFFGRDGKIISKFQKGVIEKEIIYLFKAQNAEVEKIAFNDDLCTVQCIIPLNISIQDLFNNVVDECNEFGNFLFKNYIVTNMKILSMEEIREFVHNHRDQFY